MNLDRTQIERDKQTKRISEGFKLCKGCSTTKPLSEFSVSKGKVAYRCKICFRGIINKRYSEDKTRIRSLNRASEFKNKYRITLEQYDVLLKEQNNLCAICKKHSDDCPKQILYVDHCHKSKAVRGLLCMNCNTAIGHLKDDILILESAIQYLEGN